MTGSITTSEINFRVQGIGIDELLNDSQCTKSGVELEPSFAFPSY